MSRMFGEAVHAGLVVTDIDAELERVQDMGVGPIYVMRRIRPPARYRGQRHDPLITAAFMYSGGMQLEFVQQHDDSAGPISCQREGLRLGERHEDRRFVIDEHAAEAVLADGPFHLVGALLGGGGCSGQGEGDQAADGDQGSTHGESSWV